MQAKNQTKMENKKTKGMKWKYKKLINNDNLMLSTDNKILSK
jgi:hypothetical protein